MGTKNIIGIGDYYPEGKKSEIGGGKKLPDEDFQFRVETEYVSLPTFTEVLEELWDECSSFVDNDIDSLQSVAGTTVLTRSQFATLIEKFEKRFKK